MTKIFAATCLFLFVLYLKNVLSSGSEMEHKRKEGDAKYSQLWFGPRVGRRKRNPSNEILRNVDSSEVQALMDFIRKNPWNIILMSAGKENI